MATTKEPYVEYDPTGDDPENPSSVNYLGLCIAEVVLVNFEDYSVTLRMRNAGESTRSPTTLTFPSIGNRHFFGAMPEVGDFCVCGWTMEGGFKKPVILSWIGAGMAFGKQWLTSQPFEADEYDFNDPKSRFFEGAYNRIRHKLRGMSSGDILMSSSAGSDILLDEGVLITNRRGNEIHIRDADQSIVTQSVNLYNVQAGVRVSSGTIQRNAYALPTQMFSDGDNWVSFALLQDFTTAIPVETTDHDTTPYYVGGQKVFDEVGLLTPHDIFKKRDDTEAYIYSLFPKSLNPFVFLSEMGVITKDGFQINPFEEKAETYGGKYTQRPTGLELEEFTEYRIEVTHKSDGTLPVSDQTDGLDVDGFELKRRPFIELAMGTVIGNDPTNLDLYGKPIMAKVNPRVALQDASAEKNDSNHLAYLMRLDPVAKGADVVRNPYFFGIAKDGRVYLNIQGSGERGKGFAADVNIHNGLRLKVGKNSEGKSLVLETEGSFHLAGTGSKEGNIGLDLTASGSAVKIRGEGSIADASSAMKLLDPDNEEPRVSVHVSGTDSMAFEAENSMLFSMTGKAIFSELSVFTALPKESFNIKTEGFDLLAKTVNKTIQGQEITAYTGPKDNRASNLPLRETSFTNTQLNPSSKVDDYFILAGKQRKIIRGKGSFLHKANAGDIVSHVVTTGKIKHQVATNTVTLDAADWQAKVLKKIGFRAGATMKLSATGKITVSSAGAVEIKGTVVTLRAAGGQTGGIICSGTYNPLTGSPFRASGILGSPTHRLK